MGKNISLFVGSLSMMVVISGNHELTWCGTSIKVKINQKVGAGLLESEFDWLSQIPYGETLVVVSTDWLLDNSMMIAFQIDLSVQFVRVFFKGEQHKMSGSTHCFKKTSLKTNQTSSLFLARPLKVCWSLL